MSKGMKFDSDKLDYTLVKPEMLEELATVLHYGAKKYDRDNYRLISNERYLAALFRHLQAHRKGEIFDAESGHRHLSHALSCVAIMVQNEIEDDKNMLDYSVFFSDEDLNEMEKEMLDKESEMCYNSNADTIIGLA